MFQYWPLWIGFTLLHICVIVLPTLSDDNVLHIGGIFPIAGEGGWQGGQACMPAANLALEDVNKRKDLLPGYVLKLHSNDSEVSTSILYFDFNTLRFLINNTVKVLFYMKLINCICMFKFTGIA